MRSTFYPQFWRFSTLLSQPMLIFFVASFEHLHLRLF